MVTVKELQGDYAELAGLSPEELRRVARERLTRYNTAAMELQARRKQRRIHLPAEEARLQETPPPFHTLIAPERGFDAYNFHIFTSGRDARSDRYHSHGDALKYYIYGRAIEDVNGTKHEVKAGDFMHIPGNLWHGTINPYDEPLVFLAAQQFPGTLRQTPTPFLRARDAHHDAPTPPVTKAQLQKLESRALYQQYLGEEMEYGRALLEIQRRRGQKRLYVSAEEAPVMQWGPGRHLIITPELGFDIYTFELLFEHVPARTDKGQPDVSGDTVKYYLAGRGVEVVDGQAIQVKTGDFVHIPPGSTHETRNPNNEPLRLLIWQQIPGTYTQVPTQFGIQA